MIHRDIKPANILLDAEGNPLLTDFGLALREEDFAVGPTFAGTPAYMSPEQARGEGHLVDRRTDIYGLGAVFFELLTGQRPFTAASQVELLKQIKSEEPPPLNSRSNANCSELDRICSKALAKRVSDRYGTALELAQDLRRWQTQTLGGSRRAPTSMLRPLTVASQSGRHEPPLRVVPRGLRPFEAQDADFFLELLPGPRDAHGLPDSIGFWKTRIEASDAEKTFRVGLLFGPSGCGKSSLVKAGLLPRLGGSVAPIYVEATAAETEVRLLSALRRQCSSLRAGCLVEALTSLRRGPGRPEGQKVLLVLDQFEQWLLAQGERQNSELVEALRQCDGQHVQSIILVRDDFGMAAARFMNELDIPIVQGQNFATVDRFDLHHARRVLAGLGRAFGSLPDPPAELTTENEHFLDQALAALAQGGQVISVHLILFVEMVKGRPWTLAALKEMGGIESLGVAFLEEMLGARAVVPTHRLHQESARAVLNALLPEQGSDIRRLMRSQHELLAASGLSRRPRHFNDVLRMLDTELHLITPTNPEGVVDDGGSEANADSKHDCSLGSSPPSLSACYYQLSHDYLVPPLRQWLAARQRETRRGRAQLLLAERAAVWNARPQQRQLPNWWEWATIRLYSRPHDWTQSQRIMMRAADRHRLAQAAVLAMLLVLLGWAAMEGSRYLRAVELVRALDSADTSGVANIVQDLSSCRRWADPRLRMLVEEGDQRQRLHASLALLPIDPGQMDYLYNRMLEPDVGAEVHWVLCQALRHHQHTLALRLTVLMQEETNPDRRLRAACALAFYDPSNPLWTGDTRLCDEVANKLLKEPPVLAESWLQSTRALRRPLGRAFLNIVADSTRSPSERTMAVHLSLLCKPIEVSTEEMAAFVLDTDDILLYDRILPYFLAQAEEATKLMSAELHKRPTPEMTEIEKDTLASRQAKAAVFILQYDQQESLWPVRQANCLWPLLRDGSDPYLRTYLIHRFSQAGIDPETLVRQYEEAERDTGARRAILLSLGLFKERLPARQRAQLVSRLKLLDTFREDPDAGIHSVLDWLLRSWGLTSELDTINRELAGAPPAQRRWYVNHQGLTLTLLRGPGEFDMGSPVHELSRETNETLRRKQVSRTFALATTEVTIKQFEAFLERHPAIREAGEFNRQDNPEPTQPITAVTWFQAAQYCRWLSEQEGIPEEQMCYPPVDQIQPGMTLPPDYLTRTAYRLPTEAEWEYACRAGSSTSRHNGISETLLASYAWYTLNARGRPWPVGSKMPNDHGLFDLYGNVWEWCQDVAGPYPSDQGRATKDCEDQRLMVSSTSRILRGGAFLSPAADLRSARRFELSATASQNVVGLRVAQTHK